MSNEFVMVPREPTDEMIVAFAEAWYSKRQCIDDPDMLDAYAAMLAVAPEHQGEPVALPERKDPTQHWIEPGGVHKAEGWNACLDEIAKLGLLYTRADPGEPVTDNTRKRRERWIENIQAAMKVGVPKHLRASLERSVKEIENSIQYGGTQRLRDRCEELEHDLSGLTNANDALINQRGEAWIERDRLRAKLAERDTLLQQAVDNEESFNFDHNLIGRIKRLLSASAEPSANRITNVKVGGLGLGQGIKVGDLASTKLVDILAREMQHWPDGCDEVFQTSSGRVIGVRNGDDLFSHKVGTFTLNTEGNDPHIAREEWEKARAALESKS